MLPKAFGSAFFGVNALTITIEVSIGGGNRYHIVGLPDNAIKESLRRVESAIQSAGLKMPRQKIVINLATADIRKEGSSYDLPIAIGILAASGQIESPEISQYFIMGELSLDGSLQSIKGALPISIQAKKARFKGFTLPLDNSREATIVSDLLVYGMRNLAEVVSFFNGTQNHEPVIVNTRTDFFKNVNRYPHDFSDVKGQENIKRALEIEAAGGHNLIFIAPPGAGKTMLAKRLPTILPPSNLQEALETTKIHSIAGKLSAADTLMTERPYCSPPEPVLMK